MLREVGHQDTKDQEAGKADGERIWRCQSVAVLSEVGHGCTGSGVLNAMRAEDAWAAVVAVV